MKFNTTEINALKEAIREYRGREGSFNSSAPEVEVLGKLSGGEHKEFNSLELKIVLSILHENIVYINNYQYVGLSKEQSTKNRERIVVPLKKIYDRILKAL